LFGLFTHLYWKWIVGRACVQVSSSFIRNTWFSLYFN
jgi:hypothetical protein